MKTNPIALAAGLCATAIAAPAMAQEAIQTRQQMSLQDIVAAQQRQIEAQQAQIQALSDQLHDITATLSNRVERVETQTENGRVNLSTPSARLEGPNARNSLTFVGALQATFGAVDQDLDADGDGNKVSTILHGGTEIKRARIGLQGTALNDFNYAVEVELAQLPGTTPSVAAAARDLWVQYNGFRPFSFTVGNMKPLVGLETSFSDRSNAATFAEPAMLGSMITAPGTRYVGFRAATGGSHWSAALGVYGDDVNNNGVATPFGEGYGVHGRFTYAPIATPTDVLHFGVSGYSREVATIQAVATSTAPGNPGQLRPRANPESTIDANRLIDTNNLSFAESVSLVAVEAAGFHGPIGFQAEWAQMDVGQEGVDSTTAHRSRPDLSFSGAYASANWFITGESRVYDPRTGLFTRVTPRKTMDPSSGNWGAWEIAARWSTLDLNSHETDYSSGPSPIILGVRGGEETNYTLGVNWYWNAYFRMMLNYVHADVDRMGTHNFSTGADQQLDTTADLISLRIQQEW